MERYLPGAVLAICGIAVYAIGCVLFLAPPIDIDITRFFVRAGYPLTYPLPELLSLPAALVGRVCTRTR